MTMGEQKRLFFGLDIQAPWPHQMPKGRMVAKHHRHLTLAFLGNVPSYPLEESLERFIEVPLEVGPAGYFDYYLPLPSGHPHVIAWHASFFHDEGAVANLQRLLADWLLQRGYLVDKKPWLPHVTLCRQPFETHAWEEAFAPIPFYCGGIHLYESKGDLQYIPLWSCPLKAPFEELSPSAGSGFVIRGKDLEQIYHHAITALSFKMPASLESMDLRPSLLNIKQLASSLNELITSVDRKVGSDIKAVSFPGALHEVRGGLLELEMIIDV